MMHINEYNNYIIIISHKFISYEKKVTSIKLFISKRLVVGSEKEMTRTFLVILL